MALTKKDIDQIKQLLSVFSTKEDFKDMEDRINKKFVTKDDLKDMEDRINKKFVTKDDLMNLEIRLNVKILALKDVSDETVTMAKTIEEDLIGMIGNYWSKSPTIQDLKRLESRVGKIEALVS